MTAPQELYIWIVTRTGMAMTLLQPSKMLLVCLNTGGYMVIALHITPTAYTEWQIQLWP